MGDPRGYYRLLGVPRSASADEIRLAFRARAMASHPDQVGVDADEEVFRLIREAYEVLRDPLKRMAYDAEGLDAEHATAGRAGPASRAEREPVGAAGRAARQRQPRRQLGGFVHDWLGRAVPLAMAALALALVVSIASLWAARRQLEDREVLLADLYGRLARTAEAEADLRTRLRGASFLDLERAVRRGGAVTADAGQHVYAAEIAFPSGAIELGRPQEERLGRAVVDLAQRIDAVPAGADWLIVLEAQAGRAADDAGVVVEAWEPALLRLASVLDHLLAHGLPADRLAVRFNAGFAPHRPASPSSADDPTGRHRDVVVVMLVCCAD